MKWIITSGPMETKIDNVRKIQNTSSGRLARLFAEKLIKLEYEVTFIHTENSEKPSGICKRILIKNHNQLLKSLEDEIEDDSTVIHCMAISDFELLGSINIDKLADVIIQNKLNFDSKDDVIEVIKNSIKLEDKLDSKTDQILFLEKQMKIIKQIKKVNPKVRLIGFKLLSNVDSEKLISIARESIKQNGCQYVVANLKEEVSFDKHHAYIVGERSVNEAYTKEQIVDTVIELLEEK